MDKSINGKGGEGTARVYSTSIPPPSSCIGNGRDVNGFTYRTLPRDEIQEPGRAYGDIGIKPSDPIINDVVEHMYSSDSDYPDEDVIKEYPKEGFPVATSRSIEKDPESAHDSDLTGPDAQRTSCTPQSCDLNFRGKTDPTHKFCTEEQFDTSEDESSSEHRKFFDSNGADERYGRISFRYPDASIIYRFVDDTQCNGICSTPGSICHNVIKKSPDEEDESLSKPSGYNVRELVTLSRSSVPQMRSLALGLMCAILRRLHSGEYPESDSLLIERMFRESNARISARIALDDSHISVIDRGLDFLMEMASTEEEKIWDSIYSLSRLGSSGSNVLPLSPHMLFNFVIAQQNFHDETEQHNRDILSTNGLDSEPASFGKIASLIRKDFVYGLLASDTCNRLCYLISIHRNNVNIVSKALRILTAMSAHSTNALNTVITTPDLLSSLTKNFLKINFCEGYDASDLLPTLCTVRLLRMISSCSREGAKTVLDRGIVDVLMRFVATGQSNPYCRDSTGLIGSIRNEVWLLFGSVLRYKMGFFIIEQYVEVILYYIHCLSHVVCLSPEQSEESSIVAFLRTLAVIFEYCLENAPLLAQTFFADLIDNLNASGNTINSNGNTINGPMVTALCDIISLHLKKSRTCSTFGQKDASNDANEALNSILPLLQQLISPRQLHSVLEDASQSIDKCKDLFLPTIFPSPEERFASRCGIGGSDAVRASGALLDASLKCEQWAAVCELCQYVTYFTSRIPKDTELMISNAIISWLLSKDSLKLVGTIANASSISADILRKGEWMVWFMYGFGESLVSWLRACRSIEDPQFVAAFKKSAVDIIPLVSKEALSLLFPGRELDAMYIINVILSVVPPSSPAVENTLKKMTFSEEQLVSSELCSARISGSTSGFSLEQAIGIFSRNNAYCYPSLPSGMIWPMSLIPRLRRYLDGTVGSTSDICGTSSECIKGTLQYCMDFHEQIDFRHIPPVPDDTTFHKCGYNLRRLILAYYVFLLPGEYFKVPEISDSLKRILTSSATSLQKCNEPLHSLLQVYGGFSKLYFSAVDNFKSNSFGDSLYAKYLLFMLRDDMPVDYLSYFLCELEDVLFLFESFTGGPISTFYEKDTTESMYNVLEYEDRLWFPRKCTSVDLLALWFRLLASGSLKSRSFMRAMGISFVSNSLFGPMSEPEPGIAQKSSPSIALHARDPIIIKKQIAQFILSGEETCPHNITCDEIFSWKNWPSYYYEKRQSAEVCAERRQVLVELLLK